MQITLKAFRPFVHMNLTDGTYAFTDKLKLYAAWHNGSQGKAFADVLFPLDLDDLLAIEMEYQYRYISFMNLWDTDYRIENVYRYKDQVVDMRSTWQHVTSYMFGGIIGGLYSQTSSWNETIERLDLLDSNYKNKYLGIINNAQKKPW